MSLSYTASGLILCIKLGECLFGDLGIDGKIILKCLLNKYNMDCMQYAVEWLELVNSVIEL
jgi:hypothetical protein